MLGLVHGFVGVREDLVHVRVEMEVAGCGCVEFGGEGCPLVARLEGVVHDDVEVGICCRRAHTRIGVARKLLGFRELVVAPAYRFVDKFEANDDVGIVHGAIPRSHRFEDSNRAFKVVTLLPFDGAGMT